MSSHDTTSTRHAALPETPVLVTGCSGNLGRAVVAGLLAQGRAVRGLDRVAHPDLQSQWVGDLNDRDTVARAVAGCGAVVHLAGRPIRTGPSTSC